MPRRTPFVRGSHATFGRSHVLWFRRASLGRVAGYMAVLALLAVPTIAHAQPAPDPVPNPVPETAPESELQTSDLRGAPEGTAALAARLRARHVRDLPRSETLRAPIDLARLRWLAEHDRWLVVRARALLLLAPDPATETRALILRILDSTQPAIVKAAALRATETWSLDRLLHERLERLASESDPRLSEPARRRLTEASPRTRPSTAD